MAVWQAIVLGLIQGVIGFLPVSSSGHLNLVSSFLNIQDSVSYTVLVFLHLGMLLGVFYAFKQDISRVFVGFFGIFRQLLGNVVEWQKGWKNPEDVHYKKNINSNYARFSVLISVSLSITLVTAMIVRILCSSISSNLLMNGVGFLFTALLLLVCSFTPKSMKGPKDAKVSDAIVIGLFQGLAAFPGVSLLGMTIAAGFLCGLTRKFILKYAYIMTIPVVLGGTLFEIGALLAGGEPFPIVPCLISILVASVIGILLIRKVINIITINTCRIFAGYSILIGMICIMLYLL